MKMRLLAAWMICALTIVGAMPATADLTRDDLILLGLMYRNRYVPAMEQAEDDAALRAAHAEVEALGRGGDALERYKAMIKGMAMLNLGGWGEAQQVATIFDMRVPAKIYQPGDTIGVQIAPVYEYGEHLDEHYMVHLSLARPDGDGMSKAKPQHFHGIEAMEIELRIPQGAEPGAYHVQYRLEPHADDAEPILSAYRTIFVVDRVGDRLVALAKLQNAYESLEAHTKSARHGLAGTTVNWYLDMYRRGLEEDVVGAYTGHPIFMHSMMIDAAMAIERMDFTNEFALAEALASGLANGKDPLQQLSGDMRLAYASPVDGALIPFRIFVPEGFDPLKKYPLVVALHGAGGDENSFMDRYQELYKQNAQERGYIVASVNGRGPYGGYRGASGEDVTDVLDTIEATYPIDTSRVYIMGHSMGGGGTVTVGFDNADRFAAMAPIAGFGAASQLQKAPDMPLFIGQGDQDALVPVERARDFYKAAQQLEMPHVKYVELPGVDHIAIVDLVMSGAFDWFDEFSK